MVRQFRLWSVLFATLMMSLVVAIVHRPTVFPDTADYYAGGQNLFYGLGQFARRPVGYFNELKAQAARSRIQPMHRSQDNVIGSRSPTYSALFFAEWGPLDNLFGEGLWGVQFWQSLLGASLIFLLWRRVAPSAPLWTYQLLMLGLSVASSLPWFAAFSMPDIYSGYGLIAMVMGFVYAGRMGGKEQAFLWAVMAFSLSAHGSHLLTGLAVAGVAVVALPLLGAPLKPIWARFAGVLAAVGLTFAIFFVYGHGIKTLTGDSWRRPPFLLARLLADGPGRDYLKKACAENQPLVICRFQHLPLDNSEHILWSGDGKRGVFNRSGYFTRERLELEETSFVLGVARTEPLALLWSSLKNFGQELVAVEVDDPLRNQKFYFTHPGWKKALGHLVTDPDECKPNNGSDGCWPLISRQFIAGYHETVLLISLAGVLWILSGASFLKAVKARDWTSPRLQVFVICVLCLLGVIVNAAVCGMISGVFPRYQSRIIWILPMLLGLLLIYLRPPVGYAVVNRILALPWLAPHVNRCRVFLANSADLIQSSGADAAERSRMTVNKSLRGAHRVCAQVHSWLKRRAPFFMRAPYLFYTGLDKTLVRFVIVGATGFVVDTCLTYTLVYAFGADRTVARVPAFCVALYVTWFLNHHWAFGMKNASDGLKRAAIYVVIQLCAFAANFTTYTFLVNDVPLFHDMLFLPIALGAVVGMVINFIGSKYIAFAKAHPIKPPKLPI